MIPIEITRLGLNKLFLWAEAERLQTYPQGLARVKPDRTYTRREIGEMLFDLAYVRGCKPLRENVLTNCFGAEQVAQDKLVIRGVNLFRSNLPPREQPVTRPGEPPRYFTAEDPWQPTEEALALGAAYRTDPEGEDWLILLARQLARYEVRTRLMLHLLGREAWSLRFVEEGFFSTPSIEARLVGADSNIALFANDGSEFNHLLEEHIGVSLGPWWRQEIQSLGYELADDFLLQGAMNRLPSTNMLNSALKTALWVFHTLEIIVEEAEGWVVDLNRAVGVLGREISRELLRASHQVLTPLSALRQMAESQVDPQGFLVVSNLVEGWGSLLGIPMPERETAFDRFLREKLYTEEVRVLARHPGQPRLGRGLFGDDNARKIQLEIVPAMGERE